MIGGGGPGAGLATAGGPQKGEDPAQAHLKRLQEKKALKKREAAAKKKKKK